MNTYYKEQNLGNFITLRHLNRTEQFTSLSFTNTLYLLLGLIRRLLRLCRAQIMRLCHRSTILVWAVWSVICRHLWMDVISTGVRIHVFRGRKKTASYPSLFTSTLLFQRLWQSDFFVLFVLTKNNLPCVLTGFPILLSIQLVRFGGPGLLTFFSAIGS